MLDLSIMNTESVKSIDPKRFTEFRESFGSQRKFSDMLFDATGLRIKQSHISAVERGERGLSVRALDAIASFAGTNVDFLMGRVNDPKPASDLEDQVVFGVEDVKRKEMLQKIGELVLGMSDSDADLVLNLVRRIAGQDEFQQHWDLMWKLVLRKEGPEGVERQARELGIDAPDFILREIKRIRRRSGKQ